MTVVILCPHRSGSSALAGMLHHLGVNMGEVMLNPGEHNPKGHFEDREFVEFGARFLDTRGFAWNVLPPDNALDDVQFSERAEFADLIRRKNYGSQVWGWKDPRTVLYIKAFHDLVPDPYYILMKRSEEACTKSLIERGKSMGDNDFVLESFKVLWKRHMTRFQDFIDAIKPPYVSVEYEGLISAPAIYVRYFAEALELPVAKKAIKSIDPKLRHH